MRDKHDCLAGFTPNLLYLDSHFFPGRWVERGKRLIHEDNFGIHRQGPGDGNALTLTPREDGRIFFRSEEHTSELQSLMRISYAVFCLKKKTRHRQGRE